MGTKQRLRKTVPTKTDIAERGGFLNGVIHRSRPVKSKGRGHAASQYAGVGTGYGLRILRWFFIKQWRRTGVGLLLTLIALKEWYLAYIALGLAFYCFIEIRNKWRAFRAWMN